MKIRILLADDHVVMRDALKLLLEKEDDFNVIAVAGDGREAVQLTQEHEPHVVVMDINMPNLTGIEATKQIKSISPGTKILTLSVHSKDKLIARMIEAGASGYLPKNCAGDELVNAIRTVVNQRSYISPTVLDSVVQYMQDKSSIIDAPTTTLTGREREVLQLLTEGKTTQDIASMLCVSNSTAETHRRNIMNKLEINNLADLTKYAIRQGITTLE